MGPELLNRFTINNLAKRQLQLLRSVFTAARAADAQKAIYFDLSVSLVTFTVLRQKHPETVRLRYPTLPRHIAHAWAATM